MTWKVNEPMSERVKFVGLVESGQRTVAGLCREFGICRTTAYKYISRFRKEGLEGLKERSRAPHSNPRQTQPEIQELVIDARRRHPSWGPRKLKAWLEERDASVELPYSSTIGDILKRAGLVKPRRSRRRSTWPSDPPSTGLHPNDEWNADYKGQFRLGSGEYCFPLTITDSSSRYLLQVRALERIAAASTRRWFERTFREFGLPLAIRTDNGTPFAGTGLGRLSLLSVWFMRLGIRPVRGRPHHPQDNGRHERMHRTLKAETTRPPAADQSGQQLLFDAFRKEYNHERPHEALGQRPPDRLFSPSRRPYPRKLPNVEYPSHHEVRLVSNNGCFAWKGRRVFVSEGLNEQRIGLVEIDDGLWRVSFAKVELGVLDEARLMADRTGKVYAMSPV